MSYSLEWSAKAKRDMHGLYMWIYEKNKSSADRIHSKIETAASLLVDTPRMGVKTDIKGVFRHPASKTEYTIFYKIAGYTVIILRIRHQAQDIPDIDVTDNNSGWLI